MSDKDNPETEAFAATGGGGSVGNMTWYKFASDLERRASLAVRALEEVMPMIGGDPETLKKHVARAIATAKMERHAWVATCSICQAEHEWVEEENGGKAPAGLDIICPLCETPAQSRPFGRLHFQRCT